MAASASGSAARALGFEAAGGADVECAEVTALGVQVGEAAWAAAGGESRGVRIVEAAADFRELLGAVGLEFVEGVPVHADGRR